LCNDNDCNWAVGKLKNWKHGENEHNLY
jgi:hypothetical protein